MNGETLFPSFSEGQPVCLDYETTSLSYWRKDFQALGVGVAAEGLAPYFIDFREHPQAIDWLNDQMPKIVMVGHHAKIDHHFGRAAGVYRDPKSFWCTMTAEALLDEHRHAYSLDEIAYERLGERKIVIADKTQMAALSPEKLAEYGGHDAKLTYGIFKQQLKEIEENELSAVMAMEMRLLPVLSNMEHIGVRVDISAAQAAIPKLTQAIDLLQAEINRDVGKPFNVNSTPQIRGIFKPEKISKWQYQLIDGTLCDCTKTGGPSINQNVLKEMQHPIATKIRRLRKLIKARDTFVMGHVLGHADHNDYVHTTFNQTKNDRDAGTGSGRLSSTDPALQQISARDVEFAEIIRSLFLADRQQKWLCVDHSQIDFRVACHLIKDRRIYEAYQKNPDMDFHQMVSDMTGIPRNAEYAGAPNCKQINLSLAFGAGPGKTAKTMGMPYTVEEGDNERMWLKPGPEAEAIFTEYHARFPRISAFAKEAASIGRTRGHVKTFMGRRLRFPRKVGTHKAAGLLYQSNAAEIHKWSLIRTAEYIKEHKLDARLMISCHDEEGISISDKESIEPLKHVYTDWQSDAAPYRLRVPIRCSAGTGDNWFQASKK